MYIFYNQKKNVRKSTLMHIILSMVNISKEKKNDIQPEMMYQKKFVKEADRFFRKIL